jgi:hypothetical protein
MGRPPKHYDDAELAVLRDRRNELRRAQYKADGGKRKAENQAWKEAHREQTRIAGREYQRRIRELDPEAYRAKQRAYRRKNPEKHKELYRKWYRKSGAEYSRKWHAANRVKDPIIYMLRNSKNRAKEIGRDFSLTRADIVIPEFCPVLGLKLEFSHGKGTGFFSPNSPSIDRFDSTLGYTKANIRIISWRANCLKRDATIDEMERVLAYMKGG